MPFLNLPTFSARQILTAAELNQLVAALEGFSAQAGDIAWPLLCQGNIDFDNLYTVVNLNTLWNVVNADEYDDLGAAIVALGSGGGAVFIPPNTTIDAEAADIPVNNIHIYGAGADSVIRVKNTPTAAITTTVNITDFSIKNLTINGNGDNATLVQLNGVTRFNMDGVYLTNSIAPAFLQMDKGDTADTNACRDVSVTNCEFSGVATVAHILATDLESAYFGNITSENSGGNGFRGVPDAATSKMKNIKLDNWIIDTPVTEGVYIVGDNATSDPLWARNEVLNVTVHDSTSHGIQMGFASGMLQDTTILGAKVYDSGDDGIVIDTDNGLIDGYYIEGTTTAGIDPLASTNLVVGTGQILNSTGDDFAADVKHNGPWVSTDITSHAASGNEDFGTYSLTIPASTVKIGDVIKISAYTTVSANSDFTHAAKVGAASILGFGAYTATAANEEWECAWVVHVVALSGASSTYSRFSAISDNTSDRQFVGNDATIAIDWTVDNNLVFNMSGYSAGSAAVKGITIEILGGV